MTKFKERNRDIWQSIASAGLVVCRKCQIDIYNPNTKLGDIPSTQDKSNAYHNKVCVRCNKKI